MPIEPIKINVTADVGQPGGARETLTNFRDEIQGIFKNIFSDIGGTITSGLQPVIETLNNSLRQTAALLAEIKQGISVIPRVESIPPEIKSSRTAPPPVSQSVVNTAEQIRQEETVKDNRLANEKEIAKFREIAARQTIEAQRQLEAEEQKEREKKELEIQKNRQLAEEGNIEARRKEEAAFLAEREKKEADFAKQQAAFDKQVQSVQTSNQRDQFRSAQNTADAKANVERLLDEQKFRAALRTLDGQQLAQQKTDLQARITANKSALDAIINDEKEAARLETQIRQDVAKVNAITATQTQIGGTVADINRLTGRPSGRGITVDPDLEKKSLNDVVKFHKDAQETIVTNAQQASERMRVLGAAAFAGLSSGIPVVRELSSILAGFAFGGAAGGIASGIAIGFQAIVGAVETALSAVKRFIEEGLKAAADFQERQLAIQALLSQSFRFADDAVTNFKRAGVAAREVFDELIRLAPQSIGGLTQLSKAAQQLFAQGPGIGLGLRESIQLAPLMVNAIALITGKFNDERQIITEINALLQGQARAGSELIRFLEAQNPLFEKQFRLALEQGKAAEFLKSQLQGIDQAAKALGETGTGILTTFQTLQQVFLNKVFEGTLHELVESAKDLIKFLERNKEIVDQIAEALKAAAKAALDLVRVIAENLGDKEGALAFLRDIAIFIQLFFEKLAGFRETRSEVDKLNAELKRFEEIQKSIEEHGKLTGNLDVASLNEVKDRIKEIKEVLASLPEGTKSSKIPGLDISAETIAAGLAAQKDFETKRDAIIDKFRSDREKKDKESGKSVLDDAQARARIVSVLSVDFGRATEAQLRKGLADFEPFLRQAEERDAQRRRLAPKLQPDTLIGDLDAQKKKIQELVDTQDKNKKITAEIAAEAFKFVEGQRQVISVLAGGRNAMRGSIDDLQSMLAIQNKFNSSLDPHILKQQKLQEANAKVAKSEEDIAAAQRRRIETEENAGDPEVARLNQRLRLVEDFEKAQAEQVRLEEKLQTLQRTPLADPVKKQTQLAEAIHAANEQVAVVIDAGTKIRAFDDKQAADDEVRAQRTADKVAAINLKLIDVQKFIDTEKERIEGDSLQRRFVQQVDSIEKQRAILDTELEKSRRAADVFSRLGLPTPFLARDVVDIAKMNIELKKEEDQLKALNPLLIANRDANQQLNEIQRVSSTALADLNTEFDTGKISQAQFRDKTLDLQKALRDQLLVIIKTKEAQIQQAETGKDGTQKITQQTLEWRKELENVEREYNNVNNAIKKTTQQPGNFLGIIPQGQGNKGIEKITQDIRSVFDAINSAIAGFTKNIISGIGSIVQSIGAVVSKIPGGEVAGAVIQGIGQIFSFVGQFLGRAARKLAEDLRAELQNTLRSLRFDDIGIAEAIRRIEDERNRAIAELSRKKGGRDELKKLLPEIDRQLDDLRLRARDIINKFNQDLENLRLDRNLRPVAEAFQTINQRVKEFIGAGGSVADALEFIARSAEDNFEKVKESLDNLIEEGKKFRERSDESLQKENLSFTRRIADEDRRFRETEEKETKQFNENIKKEMEHFLQGAEDDRGHLISLEAKALLDIDAAEKKFFEGREKRVEEIAKLEEEIQKIALDTQKKINDIQNEGIAVRQKSTVQDKQDRIAALQNEATDRANAVRKRIADIQREDAEAAIAHANELERINVRLERAKKEHEEKLTQLRTEFEERRALALRDFNERRFFDNEAHNERLAQLARERAEFEADHARRVRQLAEQLDLIRQMEAAALRTFGGQVPIGFPGSPFIPAGPTLEGGSPFARQPLAGDAAAATRQAEENTDNLRGIRDLNRGQLDALNKIVDALQAQRIATSGVPPVPSTFGASAIGGTAISAININISAGGSASAQDIALAVQRTLDDLINRTRIV